MMNAKRPPWLPMTLLAALLASVLAFLYIKTQSYDESSYFENIALLRQIKQLDARWELDALKAKVGITTNYDSLVDPLHDLTRLGEQMEAVLARRPFHGAAAAEDGTAFRQAIETKTALIEQFKSHNAVLRNSLAFLPTAAADVLKAASQAGADEAPRRRIGAQVDRVLLACLVYSQAASSEQASEIAAELASLAAEQARLPPGIGDSLEIFVAHARTVLREHQTVNGLLGDIDALPVSEHVEAINNLLSAEQQHTIAERQRYREYLVIFSAALIGLLLYAAAKLLRSHAVIKRVNLELQKANDSLEQRVQQRTRELQEAQAELVATAHQAGMAEIAANVLHNVGNVLNSVNISASLVGNRIRASKTRGLAKAAELINAHADDLGDFLSRDEKGKLLPGYLNQLVEALAVEQREIVEELAQLTKSIDHIKDIVATQQSYAGAASMKAPVQVRDLVEDALRMNAGALSRHEVTVVKDFAEVPVLPLDRHRVLQILVNLISNAKQAMDGGGCSHRMTLRLGVAELANGRCLRICVEDEGEGIPKENLTRIFNHGFTTRPNGHGFGLHSCILAAREMGGSLSAHSDGPGRGAIFTLELPLVAQEDQP